MAAHSGREPMNDLSDCPGSPPFPKTEPMRRIPLLALSLLATPCALAQVPTSTSADPFTHSALGTASDTTLRFRLDIPEQPLRQALTTFSRQTGVRVEIEGSVAAEPRSSSVSGTMTAPAAIRVMLDGTGFSARFEDAETVIVSVAAPDAPSQRLTDVVVTAEATRRVAYNARRTATATRTDVPLADVPQSITVVGRDLILDQSMQSMADAVRYIPGVTMGQGEGHRDAPTIRGNSSTADFFVDGVRDDAQYLRDLYNVDRVEALKGSNAMIFGRGGAGGVINRVTKEAQWSPIRTMMLEGGSFDHKRATVDIGDGFGPLFAARLNGMIEDSDQFRDATTLERYGVNPTVAALAGGTLIRLGYEHFADRRTVNRGIPSFAGRPSDSDITTFFGDPNASRSRATLDGADALIERGTVGGLLVRNRTRFARYDKYYQNVFPGSAVDATGTDVNLSAYNNATDRRNLFNQTDLTYTLGGRLEHTLVVGAEIGRQATENYRNTGYFGGTATSMSVPFDHPTVSAPVEYRQSATDADNRSTARAVSLYAQDQLALGARWQAVVGVRQDWFELDFHNNRNGQQLSRDDRMLSPRLGLVFRGIESASIYGAYSVSFLPSSGDQFSSLTVTTQALEPERFINRELGLKWDVRPDLAFTVAAYRLDRSNAAAPDPSEPTKLIQTGLQRTTGIEAGLTGNLTTRWQVAGGYAAQRATIVRATSAASAGARVPLVPSYTLSLWNRYAVTGRVGVGLGIIRQADMYAAIDNAVTLPAFTRIDGAAFVTLSPTLRVQVNVENLLDERYFATSHGNNNIMPGPSRTMRVSLTATP
jgi:catecholate siderophore receptor